MIFHQKRRVKLIQKKISGLAQTMAVKSLAIAHMTMLSRDIGDDIQMSEFVLQKNTPLGFADLGLLATVGPRTIHVYDKLIMCMKHIGCSNNTILSSNNSCAGIYILELTFEMFYLIIYFNQSIDPRPEYIRVIIIEWSIKSSIPIARIVSLDTQRSLLSARRCKGLYDYSQQTD
ncbi:unnamed protein product [Rotaria magnacalcarata]|uniref:Uncharacterized protein n=1 Tax=Rotaria magnacalcarata TaxID=392030 RepID=A0A816RDJ2_9BILA|nr:unnamed protein product [Rotaria magnacalcarata]